MIYALKKLHTLEIEISKDYLKKSDLGNTVQLTVDNLLIPLNLKIRDITESFNELKKRK